MEWNNFPKSGWDNFKRNGQFETLVAESFISLNRGITTIINGQKVLLDHAERTDGRIESLNKRLTVLEGRISSIEDRVTSLEQE